MCSHINSRDLPKPVRRTAIISLPFSKYLKHFTRSGFKQNDGKLQRLKAYPSRLNAVSPPSFEYANANVKIESNEPKINPKGHY